MERSITDCLKDTFPDFEHRHFGDDTEMAHSGDKPETGAAMEDDDNQDEDGVSLTESRLDLEKTQSFTRTDVEVETCSRNSKDGFLDEQSIKTGPMVYGSCDYDSDEEKTQSEDQELSLHEKKLREDEPETHEETSDIHRMTKEQAHVQMEDVGFLEKDPGMVTKEKTSHLLSFQMVENLEEKSSASEEEITDPEDIEEDEDIEEHAFQHAQDNKERNYFIEDDPTMSIDVQSRDDIKIFTEDDPVSVVEGLAEYPSDLSQSEDEDCPEGEPSHMNSELDEMHLRADDCLDQTENQTITSTDDIKRKNKSMNPADTATYIKNDLVVEDVCEGHNSNAGNSGIENTVESADSENFPSIALLDESHRGDSNEQRDYDSDISSDEDYMRKNIASHEQENTFAKEVVECEEDMEDTDTRNVEICDVGGLSGVQALPEAGMVDPSRYGSYAADDSNRSVSNLMSNSVKPDEDNTEHKNDVLNTGEDHNTLFPETFWRLVDEDSLQLDEYDWDVNEEEVIRDEEDDSPEELDNEEEMERDWEKERERIEAFNIYYKTLEGEENLCRSPKVTFCLDPEFNEYEEECSSSEDELNTNDSELHPAEPGSFDLHQSNKEHNSKPLEALDAGENVHIVQPETLWSTTSLMDEGNVELNEYDHDIHREDLGKLSSSEVVCDERKHFTEEQKTDGQDVKRERNEQERTDGLTRCNNEPKNKLPDVSDFSMFVGQESSETEDNESSEQESNTEDDTSNKKTKDPSDSDEPQSSTQCCLHPDMKKLPKHFQKLTKNEKEPKSKCLVLLKSVLAVSLATVVGVVSYWWATDSLDWIY